MAPPTRAAEWVDVRPLRRTCAPREEPPSDPASPPNLQTLFACNHRPPLAGVKLVQRGRGQAGRWLDTPVLGLYQVRDGKLARAQMFYFDPLAAAEFLAASRSPMA